MIKVYTTQVCPYCHALMDWLDQQGVQYEEIDASSMPDIQAVPVTEINGERIIGFDRPALKKALAQYEDTDAADDEVAETRIPGKDGEDEGLADAA